MAGETILVIDDSTATLDFAVDYLLKPNGFVPVVARDGADGLRKILQSPPDLIILDLEMPRMNGAEVMRAMKEHGLNIPVILSTAHGSEEVAVEMFRMGARDYVSKPYQVPDMLAAIERALAELRLKRERDDLLSRLVQTNRSLEARLRELDTLYGIGKSVTALLDHEGLLRRIIEAAQFVTGAQVCQLLLRDAPDEPLHSAATIGTPRLKRRPDIDAVAPQVAQTGRSIMSTDTVAVPLQVGSKLIGVLNIYNDATARHFAAHDMHLLQALADYAAIAIENSRLFRELEESKEREKQTIRNLFERYVAPSVVDQLLSSPRMAVLGGARQPITTLFADMRGFTTLAEQIQPEVLVQTLNHHLALGAQAVLKYEGTLDKFMGDAIMAFFNAPLLQPDYPLRAVKAAVEMQQSLASKITTMPLRLRLSFGIGITTGEAVVGNIGAAQLMNFTAVGHCVNFAKRLQELANGGQILIDHATYQAVASQAQIKPLGKVEIKGFRTPVQVYEVVGLR